ncbi:MAG: hypothetical protein HY858_03750 [Candidatus Solibacter usitatus]|nr:hypothetical protein [Candidatus Solibacter usitatus]
MSSTMLFPRPSKGYFTENEAAHALGISLEEFRVLVRRHIVESEDELSNLPMTSFQPSDLLLLQFLASATSHRQPAAAG